MAIRLSFFCLRSASYRCLGITGALPCRVTDSPLEMCCVSAIERMVLLLVLSFLSLCSLCSSVSLSVFFFFCFLSRFVSIVFHTFFLCSGLSTTILFVESKEIAKTLLGFYASLSVKINPGPFFFSFFFFFSAFFVMTCGRRCWHHGSNRQHSSGIDFFCVCVTVFFSDEW